MYSNSMPALFSRRSHFLLLFIGSLAFAMRNVSFPNDFLWGTATSAYQIEGAAFEDGRGASIWDLFVKEAGMIADNSTGEVAVDSYHKYLDDVELLKNLKVKTYRFSISWTRVIPNGVGARNPLGVAYYHKLLDALIEADIEPIVTLFHWDLPQILQDRGGWLNTEIRAWFKEYAKLCFDEYGSKVKYWITLNEPQLHAFAGHSRDWPFQHAPHLTSDGHFTVFWSTHNMLLAHAAAYRLYTDEYKAKHGGLIGISNLFTWGEPKNPNSAVDCLAAQLYIDLNFGLFTEPLIYGKYPDSVREELLRNSQKQGRTSNILPEFSDEESALITGSIDFLGLNYYVTLEVSSFTGQTEQNWIHPCINAFGELKTGYPACGFCIFLVFSIGPAPQWIHLYPAGFYKALNYASEFLNGIPILVTENGCMDTPGEGLQDKSRILFLKNFISALALSIENGANIFGYTVWSLMDNFEWTMGYTTRFGLHHVDFDTENKTRTPKDSVVFYKNIIENNAIEIDPIMETEIDPSRVKTSSDSSVSILIKLLFGLRLRNQYLLGFLDSR